MLQSLDTLIAFVVIMTIVSLFVTILVQMVSAALSLRGKNLANALALTFQTIDPSLEETAHHIADKILTDPLLSDSTRTDKNRGSETSPERDKPWHFLNMFGKASKLASAIRPEEVYRALQNLAAEDRTKSAATRAAEAALSDAHTALTAATTPADQTTALANVAAAESTLHKCRNADSQATKVDFDLKKAAVQAAQQALDAIPPAGDRAAAQAALAAAQAALENVYPNNIAGIAQQLLAGLGTPADKTKVIGDKLNAVAQLAATLPPGLVAPFQDALTSTAAQLVQVIDTEHKKLEDLFSSAQDRAQQWFQLHTRGITIGASIIVAFLFQLDAVEVFHYVSTNATARAVLVASADKVVKQGDGILENKAALIERINKTMMPETDRLSSAELKEVVNTSQLHDKVLEKAKTHGGLDEAAFTKTVGAASEAYYKEQRETVKDLTKEVSATGFELVPIGFWRWPTVFPKEITLWGWGNRLWTYWSHGIGMLLFAGLLSLGAPYWYNLLKTLSSLRPALAQLIGNEDAAQPPPQK